MLFICEDGKSKCFLLLKKTRFFLRRYTFNKIRSHEKMVGVLAIVFLWVHCVGEWRTEKIPFVFSGIMTGLA